MRPLAEHTGRCFQTACCFDDLRAVKMILAAGADVNFTQEEDFSPLFLGDHVPIVELLLASGANANVTATPEHAMYHTSLEAAYLCCGPRMVSKLARGLRRTRWASRCICRRRQCA